jgi:hypothetical protein
MDQRQHVRVDVTLPCHLRMAGQGSVIGDTVNISRGGLLVRCREMDSLERLPEVGDLLTVDVALPASPVAKRKCLHCQATIVRLVSAGDLLYLALSFDKLQFRLWRPMRFFQEEQALEMTERLM